MIEVNSNPLGVFALKNGRVIKSILFKKDASSIAERLIEMEDGVCGEEDSMIKYLIETNTKEIKVRDPDRFSRYRGDIKLLEDKKPTRLAEITSEIGFPEKDLKKLISDVSLQITRRKMKRIGRDQMIMHAVASLDELEESINTLIKRLREWYSLNFPELDFLVKKHDLYAELVAYGFKDAEKGLRENIEKERKDTLGVQFTKGDYTAARVLAKSVLELYKTQKDIESYIAEAMGEAAPNLSALAGPTLGARIISLAGGLERLSVLPASTIQVLGAEDAFFRFLRTKRDPPKHGVIFQLPEIRSAPKKVRGKISRMFAAKLAIAAKADRFNGDFIGEKLREDFLKKAEKLK